MFLANLSEDIAKQSYKVSAAGCTYNSRYNYWMENLFERVMRLFVWDGTKEVLPKEIEQRLIVAGFCGISKMPREKELTAFWATMYEPTKYGDEWKRATVRCPIYSGQRTIGKDIAIINNSATRNPILPLINHYAQLLAHTEVTYLNVVINARDAAGIPVTTTEKQKIAVNNYKAKRFNGVYSAIADPGSLGINYVAQTNILSETFKELWQTRNNILKDFYSDIGVKAAFEKQSNTVEAEVRSNDSMLLLNIRDMLDSRRRGCDAVNNLYGVEWEVKVADEINYKVDDLRGEEELETDEND